MDTNLEPTDLTAAPVADSPLTLARTRLSDTYAARALAREAHAADVKALANGRQVRVLTKSILDGVLAERDQAKAARARILEAQVRGAAVESVSELLPNTRRLEESLVAAQLEDESALAMVAKLEADERNSNSQLVDAERAVHDAAKAVVLARAILKAVKTEAFFANAIQLGTELRELTPDPLNTPLNRLSDPPPVIQRVFDLLTKLQPDQLNIPLHITRAGAMGLFQVDTTYEEHLAALINGDESPSSEASQ